MSQTETDPVQNESLEKHLERENPLLLEPLHEFRSLDRVARKMGMLTGEESFTRRVSWWPVVSLLGTFSAGKSSFINAYLGAELQRTGNQAVDDRFTVICYGDNEEPRTLPGSALDADQRFPFYRMSGDIDEVSSGEGQRINNYLQLKVCNAEIMRGKILLDSPGFDADTQRSATLQITDRIIDLSDLVLVFFDARHPEPGAMRDTLEHLVTRTIHRDDSAKFVYVLNQVDAAAREDNPEDVVAAWQRALASCGLTAGRFLRIYNEDAAAPIADKTLAERFKTKKDEDMEEIHRRMRAVEIDRAYRIVDLMKSAANTLIGDAGVGRLKAYRSAWRRRTLIYDALALVPFIAALVAALIWMHDTTTGWLSDIVTGTTVGWISIAVIIVVLGLIHFAMRRAAAGQITRRIDHASQQPFGMNLRNAFRVNTRWWRSIFLPSLKGWNMFARRRVEKITSRDEAIVSRLNDRFTQPSG